MTDEQHRISKLEDKYHDIDRRQESFETYTRQRMDSFEEFVKNYIDSNEKRMDRLEGKLDNLMIGGGIGVATILATMIGVVVALK